jgi:glutathione peroxidase-family protein
LQAHLWCDVPDVREGRDQGRRRPVGDLFFLGSSGNLPAWNFSKYVIGKDGKIVAFFPSKITPDAPELRAAIDQALAAK